MRVLKVLFIAANPTDTSRLTLAEEAREIEQKLRGARYRDLLAFKTVWAAQPDDLLQALIEDTPHVLHISGHGNGEKGLVFQDKNGRSRPVTGEKLRLLLKSVSAEIKIVVLNACLSRVQAQALRNVVDVVVGMDDEIDDAAARLFAASFYRALAFGNSVQQAFDQGLVSIALEGDDTGQQSVPVMLHRPRIRPEKTYLVGDELSITRFHDHAETGALRFDHAWQRIGDVDQPVVDRVDLVSPQLGRKFLEDGLQAQFAPGGGFLTFSVALFDIDYLTIINKQYDRAVGNEVIGTVGKLLLSYAAPDFEVGRCGDDTFFVVLKDVPLRAAMEFSSKMVLMIRDYEWDQVAVGLHVTCSCGVAEMQEDEEPRMTAVRAAYGFQEAKKKGGSRAVRAPFHLRKGTSRYLSDHFS